MMHDFNDFLEYLFVTDQLDEVFWGKKKEKPEEPLILKRSLSHNIFKDEDNSKGEEDGK